MPELPRFFRSPKGQLIVILAAMAVLAMAAGAGWSAWPSLAGAVAAAAAIDLVVLRLARGGWELPIGAILTGLIIAMVLAPQEPWYVSAVTSVIAIGSKYLIRTRSANIFNPAALAIVITFYAFHTGQSWWGSLAELHPVWVAVLMAAGVFITVRVNRMPIALVFLGTYFLLFTAAAFLGEPRRFVEIFRPPDVHAALFFAFFILTDPPTSPVRYPHQVACGVIVAVASFAVFELTGAAHYLLSGVLAGNLWEGWRRAR